jgi:hypothetical protein
MSSCVVKHLTLQVRTYFGNSAGISKVGENKQLLIGIVSGNFSHILLLMNPSF